MTMTSTATATNGRPRRQLADQLDRLDGIIDALAEGLNGAVADAAREGTRLAVKDAILEILTNPDLRALIATAAPADKRSAQPVTPPGPPALGWWGRAKAKAAAVTRATRRRWRSAAAAVAGTARLLSTVMPLKRVLLTGAVIGAAVGVACYLAPHGVASAVSGVGAAVTAVAAQVGGWFRRATRVLGVG